MNDHKAIHTYRRGTPSARQVRGYIGDPDLNFPDRRLVMKLDSELVEQSGTQRCHRPSTNCILKADYVQINHRHRFADPITSSDISHAETKAPSVAPNTPLSISRPESTKLVAFGHHF